MINLLYFIIPSSLLFLFALLFCPLSPLHWTVVPVSFSFFYVHLLWGNTHSIQDKHSTHTTSITMYFILFCSFYSHFGNKINKIHLSSEGKMGKQTSLKFYVASWIQSHTTDSTHHLYANMRQAMKQKGKITKLHSKSATHNTHTLLPTECREYSTCSV